VREVREETGYDVELEAPLVLHSCTDPNGPRPPRPYKSVRIVYSARVIGGTLGTLEVGGTTDHAAWIPLGHIATSTDRADIVDVAMTALRI
jgi:8-oxo-dGTP diphosphatase